MINDFSGKLAYEKLEDTKGIFRMRKLKKDITYTMGLRKGTKGQINRKSLRQSIMANADKLATLGTKDTGQRKRKQKNTSQKTTKMSNTNTFVNRRWTQAFTKSKAVPASYKTPVMLLINNDMQSNAPKAESLCNILYFCVDAWVASWSHCT